LLGGFPFARINVRVINKTLEYIESNSNQPSSPRKYHVRELIKQYSMYITLLDMIVINLRFYVERCKKLDAIVISRVIIIAMTFQGCNFVQQQGKIPRPRHS
jgi:hypothetical protein